jgi:hypothetical protein
VKRRHCGKLLEYNGDVPEEACFYLPEIFGRRLYYINISLDVISYHLHVLTIMSPGKKILLRAILENFVQIMLSVNLSNLRNREKLCRLSVCFGHL